MAAPLLETPLDRTRGVVMTSTERAKKFKANAQAAGLAQFNVWLPVSQHAELKALVEMLKKDCNLNVVSVSLQDQKTGRMKGVKLR
jgi:hypothetical protein